MPDGQHMATGPYRPTRYAKNKGHRPVSIEGLPTDEELAEHAKRHKGENADRFTLYTPEQIDALTKDARITLTFRDVIKIRDQAEMVRACMEVVIKLTRRHDMGSVQQRIETRREIASLIERLGLFNDRTPYGYRPKRRVDTE